MFFIIPQEISIIQFQLFSALIEATSGFLYKGGKTYIFVLEIVPPFKTIIL